MPRFASVRGFKKELIIFLHRFEFCDFRVHARKLAAEDFLVVEFRACDSLALVFPILQVGDVKPAEFRLVRLFRPKPRLAPIVEARLVAAFRLVKVRQIFVAPRSVVKANRAFVVHAGETLVLFDQFQVQMHLEKVAIFFPLFFVFDFRHRIERIHEVRAHRLFKPINVFHAVVWELLVMDVIEAVEIFLVFYHIRKARQRAEYRKQRERKNNFRKLFHALIIGKTGECV